MNDPGRRLPVFRLGQKDFDFSVRTYIMGILNVTPDSFSDGGRYIVPEKAVEHAMAMIDEGADIIDVGGESTRPKSVVYGEGSKPVGIEEELRRVLPVIRGIVAQSDVPVSVDTMKSIVARECLEAGAVIVNDVSGFRSDGEMPRIVGEARASAVVMHMRGSPKTMQQDTSYEDLFGEITDSLRHSIEAGVQFGVRQMFVDPGIGFGKTLDQNLRLLAGLARFRSLGYPIVVGPSRKSFIGALLDAPVGKRLEGSLAATVASVLNGANVVRVHDVREAKRAVTVADAIREAGRAALPADVTGIQ